MAYYKNFKTVVYCVAPWAGRVTEAELKEEIEFFQRFVGVDKVYLETFRGEWVSQEQLDMCKRVFAGAGIEVSGGITTVTPNLNDDDQKRQRLFNTFCYNNGPMRELLKQVAEFTARNFDEFIIDDFFFTQCTCEDCLKDKAAFEKEHGKAAWEAYRLAKMKEVSENLVIKPAKAVNPKVKIIIKFPNWKESYQETGYNPAEQKDMFDLIYTGTETRDTALQDQHLPRYLSYSLVRYLENTAPGRNGGAWFDPYQCYTYDTYLEQAYLSAFSKAGELMIFCWPSLYKNKFATALGFRLQEIDACLGNLGKPVGLPLYLPHNAQGEDHLEDFLGMAGIPFEPTPEFPVYAENEKSAGKSSVVIITAMALKDKNIIEKIKDFAARGGKVICTSGFMIGALEGAGSERTGDAGDISDMTGIRYRGRRFEADTFHVTWKGLHHPLYAESTRPISFPMLEHRNNASWSLINAGRGDAHSSILLRDTYGKGELLILNVPDLYSQIKELPREVLKRIRAELSCGDIYLDAKPGVSIFTYDNDTFAVYTYTASSGAAAFPDIAKVHIKGKKTALRNIAGAKKIKPLYQTDEESIFEIDIIPGEFEFYQY
ncbi:MAG: hypothetical protein LBM77_09280 [Spirochaetaceae bacterium]|jgi:hypothetical protein|nr:hypothetical protein [Spirochaetaceae bacterium]